GGESGYIANDPLDPNVYYAGSYGGELSRFDYSNGQTRAVNIVPDNPMGYSSSNIPERFQWTYPIIFDPQDKNTLYAASQHVWKSNNAGQSWERISPDLTRHDPATLAASGGPITLDQTGVETFGTIFALQPSRLEPTVIWAGSDDGLVHVTRDNGQSWTDVTPRSFPKYLKITTIEDSPSRPGTAFLAGNQYLLDDLHPYLFKTSDYGKHWTSIGKGIPADEVVHSIREDPARRGLLYLGTERGVWISFDDGLGWQKLQRNLPVTQVADLAVTDHDLVIATHGRSFWVLDNIDVLRQLDHGSGNRALQLFRPAPATRGVDPGVIIDYYLPKKPTNLTIDVLDSTGKVIRSFAGAADIKKDSEDSVDDDDFGPKPAPKPTIKPGLNRYTWDMHYPGFTEFKGMIFWAARNRGPLALPGQYQVRLTVDGQAQVVPVEIRLDPRVKGVTQADLQKRFALATEIEAKVSQANETVLLIRGIRTQIDAILKRTGDLDIRRSSQGLQQKLDAIEGHIYQTQLRSSQDPLNYPIMLNNKLAALAGVVESGESAPTEQSYAVFADLSKRLETELESVNRLLAAELPPINAKLAAAHLPSIERRPEAAVEPGTATASDVEADDD
ncbi:MAG TPA: glycosyl hydrolase, partial [Sphingomicrobium sp.]|nr:glycosyl hydrolase [Sphingomicrobium sp.]